MDPLYSGFQPKSCVTDPQELFGYNEPEGILDQVCTLLAGGTHMQVLGERGAGKTSLLQCVRTRFLADRPRHLPVYLEFHGTSVCDPIGAYRYIVAKIHAMFLQKSGAQEELSYGGIRMSANPADDHYVALKQLTEYQMRSGFTAYFEQLTERGYGVLLLVDEYEYFLREVLQSPIQFWTLRNVAEISSQSGRPHPLTIALAGARDWSHYCGGSGSPPLNIVSAVRVLPPLSRESFRRMWDHCLGQCGKEARSRLEQSGVTSDQVYRWAGGWAFFGKAIGQHLITHKRLNREQLAAELKPHFKVLWEQRTDAERQQLLAVARGATVPSDHLDELRRRGLVEVDDQDRACLRGELWEQWVKAQLPSHPVTPGAGDTAPNLFRRRGDCYDVRFDRKEYTFGATYGFHYLAELLSRKNQLIGALELEEVACKAPPANPPTEDDEAPRNVSAAQDVAMDPQGVKEILARLEEVKNRIKEICNQDSKKEELKSLEMEKQGLEEYLKSTIGLGGQPRPLWSSEERKAYQRVRKALNNAYDIIGKELPKLVCHLRCSIKGTSCSFAYWPALDIDNIDIEWEF